VVIDVDNMHIFDADTELSLAFEHKTKEMAGAKAK
jgi:hypothetical protein